MQFGVCAGTDKAATLATAGADYIELSVTGALIPLEDEAAWTTRRAELMALPLPTRTFNVFLPGSLRIVGPDSERTDAEPVRQYVFTALRRAKEIGGETIVFGSGGARRVPEGFAHETARAQIQDFLRLCAEACAETGITIAIEPLNRGECNIINSVGEAVRDYVTVLNDPGIRVLADTYHMEREDEPLSILGECAPYLAHVHTADTKRVAPGQGQYDHVAVFRALRAIGYDRTFSIEANFSDFDTQVAGSLAHVREAHRQAAER